MQNEKLLGDIAYKIVSLNNFPKKQVKKPYDILRENLEVLLKCHDYYDPQLLIDIPKKWERHGDLIILPPSFQDSTWRNFGSELWETVAKSLKCQRLAQKQKVCNDKFRTPQIILLKGDNGWITHIDNHIKYTYDVTKCMFSCGNITEKLRIAKFDCQGETIVDLYAGIGYFTLPYLVHAKASHVHACDWNPSAVEALKKNLILNKVQDKATIYFGDNREVCPKGVADRVNLGLIPSSKTGWETACMALKPTGGILHVHGNVTSGIKNQSSHDVPESKCEYAEDIVKINYIKCKVEWKQWAHYVNSQIKEIYQKILEKDCKVNVNHIQHIKSYAPHVDHIVLDIECRPINIK